MIVRMWEARVAPGRLDEAVAWVRDEVVPGALAAGGCLGAEAFVAAGEADRVVVITRWQDGHADGWEEGAPGLPLLERFHAWWFEPLPSA